MKSIVLTLLSVVFCMNLQAAISEKKYEKSFNKNDIQELVISNRYGKVEVKQTDDSEVRVVVNMTVTAKTDSKAVETMEMIGVGENLLGTNLNIETLFKKDMAFKQLLSGISINVDYKISIPKGIKLRIINTNGNVYVSDFVGELNVDIKSGDFKGGTVKGNESFYIKQDKGSFEVTDVQFLSGDFKGCDMRIESGDDVRIVTSDCDALFGPIEKLNIRSSGGHISLGEVEEMTGSSSLTKYEIQEIGGLLNMDMKMGEINVRSVHVSFSEVNVKGSFTKVGLTFMPGAGYTVEIKHNKSLKMDLPTDMKLEQRPTSEKNVIVDAGFFGDKKYSGKVLLNMTNGNLYIQ